VFGLPLLALVAWLEHRRYGGLPTRPIRLYVGFPAGAQTDSLARIVGAALAGRLRQSVVIENRSGVSGAIAAEVAARAPADGYTLLIGGNSNMVLAPLVVEKLPYDPVQDFVPIGRIARVPLVVAVNAKVPASSFPELLALARANPGTLTFASGSLGTQVAVDLVMDSAGVKVINVPYKGSAPAIPDVVAGRVDCIFADYALLAPHADSGALRLLARPVPRADARRCKARRAAFVAISSSAVAIGAEPCRGRPGPRGRPSGAARCTTTCSQMGSTTRGSSRGYKYGIAPFRPSRSSQVRSGTHCAGI
jgi:tripartite-type tricarboxylate transporter receptor subunit TctC